MTRRWPLVAVLGAHGISVAGNALTMVAVPWFVLQTTGSAAQTGLAAGAATLPVVLSGLFAGPLVDRIGYVRTSVAADLASGATVLAIPLLYAAGALPLWALLALVVVSGLFDTPGERARIALLPDVAALAGVRLERATAALDGVERGARMVGAPLAGLLLTVADAPTLLLLDAATFAVAAVVVAAARAPARDTGRAPTGYLAELREGFAFVRADRLIRAIIAMVLVTNLLDAAWSGVLLPVYAERVLDGPADLGWLIGVWGVGALTGTLAFGAVGHRLPRWPTYTAAFLVAGAPRFFLFAAEPGLPALLVALFAIGCSAGAINPIIGVVEFERIPATMRARVMGASSAGAWLAMPFGAILGGVLIERAGLTPTLRGLGAAYLAATLAPLLLPVWRAVDRPTSATASTEAPVPPGVLYLRRARRSAALARWRRTPTNTP